jgi:hypothetical protein
MKGNAMESGDILTPNQLAERLQVGVPWVYEKSRSRGKHSGEPLPVLRCGRYLRFYWPDVCAWLRASRDGQARTFSQSVRTQARRESRSRIVTFQLQAA